MLIPTTCPACGERGRAPCAPCAARLRPAPDLPPPPGVGLCLAFFDYEGPGRELVARLKYRNARSAVPFLAKGMAAVVAEAGRAAEGFRLDVVTWAPTTPARRRARGFDQAELLARGVGRALSVPCRRLLWRGPGPAQTGRDAAARLNGPTFVVRRALHGEVVLLIDDVVTTGATVGAAARALDAAGAARTHVVAAARTAPMRRHVHSAMAEQRSQSWK